MLGVMCHYLIVLNRLAGNQGRNTYCILHQEIFFCWRSKNTIILMQNIQLNASFKSITH